MYISRLFGRRVFSSSYYDILNIPKSASSTDIKKAFFELAKKYHPDTNKDSEAPKKFIEAKKAYEVLSDPHKRQLYDSGSQGAESDQYDPNVNTTYDTSAFSDFYKNFSNFDVFNELFNEQHARDIEIMVKVDFIVAAKGGSQTVPVRRQVSCKTCHGKGHKGSAKSSCYSCNGTGFNSSVRGGFVFTNTCRACRGTGKTFKDICDPCNGRAFVDEVEHVTVDVPSGIESGDVVRYQGKGNHINGRAGNLFVQFQVLPHKTFKRENENIFSNLDVSLLEALEGCGKKIDTIEGPIDVSIPKGTQPGQKLRLRYKGLKSSKTGKYGDHILTVNVNIPLLEPEQIIALKSALSDVIETNKQ